MSEQTSQEPTMEEILASIRRIISEDETPPADGDQAAEAQGTEESPAPQAAEEHVFESPPAFRESETAEPAVVAAADPIESTVDEDEEDALELTQKVETHGDIDVLSPEPALAAAPVAAATVVAAAAVRPDPAPVAETLVSDHTAQAAASAFGQLSANFLMPPPDRTLEDLVRELLRPMLQQWLDDNLPAIVQQSVQAEVERIARSRVR